MLAHSGQRSATTKLSPAIASTSAKNPENQPVPNPRASIGASRSRARRPRKPCIMSRPPTVEPGSNLYRGSVLGQPAEIGQRRVAQPAPDVARLDRVAHVVRTE